MELHSNHIQCNVVIISSRIVPPSLCTSIVLISQGALIQAQDNLHSLYFSKAYIRVHEQCTCRYTNFRIHPSNPMIELYRIPLWPYYTGIPVLRLVYPQHNIASSFYIVPTSEFIYCCQQHHSQYSSFNPHAHHYFSIIIHDKMHIKLFAFTLQCQ